MYIAVLTLTLIIGTCIGHNIQREIWYDTIIGRGYAEKEGVHCNINSNGFLLLTHRGVSLVKFTDFVNPLGEIIKENYVKSGDPEVIFEIDPYVCDKGYLLISYEDSWVNTLHQIELSTLQVTSTLNVTHYSTPTSMYVDTNNKQVQVQFVNETNIQVLSISSDTMLLNNITNIPTMKALDNRIKITQINGQTHLHYIDTYKTGKKEVRARFATLNIQTGETRYANEFQNTNVDSSMCSVDKEEILCSSGGFMHRGYTFDYQITSLFNYGSSSKMNYGKQSTNTNATIYYVSLSDYLISYNDETREETERRLQIHCYNSIFAINNYVVCYSATRVVIHNEIDCDKGYKVQTEGTSLFAPLSCVPCPVGYYFDGHDIYNCKPCELGQFSNTTATVKCKQCPMGTFSNETASVGCRSCPKGTKGTTIGATHPVYCHECEEGEYQDNEGSSSCSKCSAGTFSSSRGSIQCDDCPAHRFQPNEGQNKCDHCYANFKKTRQASCPMSDNVFAIVVSVPTIVGVFLFIVLITAILKCVSIMRNKKVYQQVG
ncbi:hypothetical protein AKO1_005139 [Acrasis kona]|uniref:Tyrosine-protein kinase ephrin type A/B receptor-like domain-containing protein n=1 Tax=Acrasis kona TaxID=1008807 RepID=A0AAW2YHC6_9EUKA